VRAVYRTPYKTLIDGSFMVTPRSITLAALVSGGLALGGCGASQSVATQEALDAMTMRVEELERSNGRARTQIQDMEERIFLLQDRVEAHRIALGRRNAAEPARSSVHIGPQSNTSTRRANQTPTSSAPPPPFPDIDPITMPDLPVERVVPETRHQPQGAPVARAHVEDEGEEVVINMDVYHQRFAHETSLPSSGRTPSAQPRTSSGAYAPVDVGGARLPVPQNVPPMGAGIPPAHADSVSARTSGGHGGESPLATYQRALDEFNRAEYIVALASLNEFIRTDPQDDYMDNAFFWIGECYYGMGQYSEALGYFQRVVSDYPDGNKVPDSLLKIALTYERLENVSSAREVLAVLVETYPTTDAARRASERLRALQ